MKNNSSKKLIISILGVILLVIAVVGISYAAFNYSKTGQTINSITTSTIVMNYTEKENGINLVNAMPTEDVDGKVLTGAGNVFDFTVSANISGETIINYAITGSKVEGTTLPDSAVKVWLTSADDAIIELDGVSSLTDDAKKISELKLTKNDASGAPNNQYVLKTGVITASETTNYRLRMWIASDYSLQSEKVETYKLRVNVYGSTEVAPKIPSETSAVDALLTYYTNDEETQDYDINYLKNSILAKENKMYVFNHTEGAQQSGWGPDELKSYRYIGANPNNYVTFNNETAGWRIIGIETVDNGSGTKEKRIKLIRKDPLTPNMAFDNKPSGTGSAETDFSSNDWTDSRLMMVLNENYDSEPTAAGGKGSMYWNRQSGSCPTGQSEGTTSCNFGETGLLPESQEMIGDAKWFLGGTNSYDSASTGLVSHWYSYERGKSIYQSDTHPRKESWTGKVGLMYPSDYGYATSGGNATTKEECLNTIDMRHWYSSGSDNKPDCYNNDWLYNSGKYQWTITSNSSNSFYAFVVGGTAGHIDGVIGDNANVVRPVVYLTSDVKYKQGDGSSGNPFVFTK